MARPTGRYVRARHKAFQELVDREDQRRRSGNTAARPVNPADPEPPRPKKPKRSPEKKARVRLLASDRLRKLQSGDEDVRRRYLAFKKAFEARARKEAEAKEPKPRGQFKEYFRTPEEERLHMTGWTFDELRDDNRKERHVSESADRRRAMLEAMASGFSETDPCFLPITNLTTNSRRNLRTQRTKSIDPNYHPVVLEENGELSYHSDNTRVASRLSPCHPAGKKIKVRVNGAPVSGMPVSRAEALEGLQARLSADRFATHHGRLAPEEASQMEEATFFPHKVADKMYYEMDNNIGLFTTRDRERYGRTHVSQQGGEIHNVCMQGTGDDEYRLVATSEKKDLSLNILASIAEAVLNIASSVPSKDQRVEIAPRISVYDNTIKFFIGVHFYTDYAMMVSPRMVPTGFTRDAVQSVACLPIDFSSDKQRSHWEHRVSMMCRNISDGDRQENIIATTSSTISTTIPICEVVTNFDHPRLYHVSLAEALSNLDIEKVEKELLDVKRRVWQEYRTFTHTFMDDIGRHLISLLFNKDMEAAAYRTYYAMTEATLNKFVKDTPYKKLGDFDEALCKSISTCMKKVESYRNLLNEKHNVRETCMINLVDASPSRRLESFGRYGNHLVIRTPDGEFAYYKLELRLSEGETGVHKITRFPKVFAEGYVIAPNRTYYKVTSEDLIRGRILRSQEVTFDAMMGDLTNGEYVPRGTSGNNRSSGDTTRSGTGVESAYQEFGFVDDPGDEESEIIDMALQDQMRSLYSS